MTIGIINMAMNIQLVYIKYCILIKKNKNVESKPTGSSNK
ncbi:hypothetical protein MPF_0746 [Methanohalophilus portucalensis FDF-1]|uniref:Uncharacterized protein n=1 Tax=Methanohalophilus portucalensis FDF-1 TaxID=523843 RepID=A0A1L9C609_9EURY|nr:hypothetical protein MPF_0746 [Methanohalophilus portucalensis FDF-1]